MLALRDYQHTLVEQARAQMRKGVRRLLLTSPTGSGKTVLIAHMLASAAAKGKRAWFIVHRRELLRQSVLTLTNTADVAVGIVSAGHRLSPREQIQVCGIQSLVRRMEKLPAPDVIVWDECHHVASKSWRSVHARYASAVHIGLTATPQRLDGHGLKPWFDVLLHGPSVAALIEQGYLSPYRLFAPPKSFDLSGVHTLAGDYNAHEVDAELSGSTIVGDAVTEYQQRTPGARALLFAWSVAASRGLVARFLSQGIPAAHVDGTTPERARDGLMASFRSGETRVLSNVDIVSEGFDVPAIEAVYLLRPTASLGLYLQQVGRALRPAPGKTAIIVDHVGNHERHGLPDDPRDWTLDGRPKRDKPRTTTKSCPMCYGVVALAVARCPLCGHAFVAVAKPREIEQVDGTLTEVDLKAVRRARAFEEASCSTLADFQALAKKRGYKAAWAFFRFQARQARVRRGLPLMETL